MQLPRLLTRVVAYGVLPLLVLMALIAGTIQVQNQLVRSRAERLLKDVLAIDLRHTTFQEADEMSARWNGFQRHDLPCSRLHCDIRISLPMPALLTSSPRLLYLYGLFGGRAGGVTASINVRNGFAWGKGYTLAVPAIEVGSHTEFYGLVAEISTDWVNQIPDMAWPNTRRHPEYDVGGPDACTGCVAVFVHFSPFADPGDIRRLSQIKFSCLTGLQWCRTKQDIMPVAMAELSEEMRSANKSEQPNCDLKAIEILSRDLEHAAVFEVVGNRAAPEYYQDTHRILEVRLLERLKGASFWEPGASRSMDVRVPLALAPIDGLANVRTGERIIILFWRQADPRFTVAVGTEMCGVVPYSDNNLAVVRAGIAEDDRVPPLIEYNPAYRPHKSSDPPDLPWSTRLRPTP